MGDRDGGWWASEGGSIVLWGAFTMCVVCILKCAHACARLGRIMKYYSPKMGILGYISC